MDVSERLAISIGEPVEVSVLLAANGLCGAVLHGCEVGECCAGACEGF
jgi:hypothetical protein